MSAPSALPALKINEARTRAIGALDDATDNHVGLIHMARLFSLLDKRLNRVPLTTSESQQWRAALGFAQGVLQANDDLSRFAVSPVGTLRISPALFTQSAAAPGDYRLGIEQGTLNAAIAAEASARAAAVSSEANTRSSADSALSAALTAEGTARANADAALQTNITAEASSRAAADTAEVTARNSAIASALTWGVSSVSRSFDTAYQPSATKTTLIVASVAITCGTGADGQAVLYIGSTGSPVSASNYRAIVRNRCPSPSSGSFTQGSIVSGGLIGIVPPGYYYEVARETTLGTPSWAFPFGVLEYTIGP